jgi:predicted dehydrogenase
MEKQSPQQTSTRRDFVKDAGVAAAGWTIIQPESVYGAPANSKIKVGLLGCGRRGSNVSELFVKNENSELTALADIYDDQIAAARNSLPAPNAQAYKSAQAILDADIDAIYIATPPYVHPEHFELAVASGKHILMEKPVAVDPAGIRRVLAAAKNIKPGQVVMVDYQQRWGKDYKRAYELVLEGAIGEIRMIRSAWLSGGLPVRKGHPESEEKVRNWLFYKELSGDIIVEQNCHNIDVVNWFTGAHPVSATGYGARVVRTDIGDIMDSLAVNYKLPDGRIYTHSANQMSAGGYRDVGEYFFGTKGVIETSRRGFTVHAGGKSSSHQETNYNITEDVIEHFVKATRGEVPADNATLFAAESTLTAIMGRIAIDLQREVTWDEVFNM